MPATASPPRAGAAAAVSYWDADALRFRDSRGRFIAESRIREAVDAVATGAADEIERLTKSLVDGSLDLGSWEQRVSTIIKRSHLANAVVARGGRDRMDAASFGRVGQRIRFQYKHLREFAREIDRGEAGSAAEIVARARKYGASARLSYGAVRRADLASAGLMEEHRFTTTGNSCAECSDYANRGWVPAGTLPNVGEQCSCKSNCACYFEMRRRGGPPGDRGDLALPAGPPPADEPGAPVAATPAAPATALPPAPTFGPSLARVRHLDIDRSEIKAAVRKVLGPEATIQDLASLAGATDDAIVDVGLLSGPEIQLTTKAGGFETVRRLRRNLDGDLVLINDQFYVDKERQGQGLGTRVFGRQVEAAARLGVKKVSTFAAGYPGGAENGYAVWPKFGYDGEIPPMTKAKLPPGFAGAERLSDLMRTKEGRGWWTENGESVGLTFDMTDGSLSRRVWDGYLGRRAARNP